MRSQNTAASLFSNLGTTPLPWVLPVNVLLFVGIIARMVPTQILISAIPDSGSRRAFMAVNSSLPQISGGVASVLSGLIVAQRSTGRL